MGGNLFSRRSQLRNLTDSLDALPCIRSAFSIQPSLVRSLPAKDAEVPVAGIPLVNHFHSFYNLCDRRFPRCFSKMLRVSESNPKFSGARVFPATYKQKASQQAWPGF